VRDVRLAVEKAVVFRWWRCDGDRMTNIDDDYEIEMSPLCRKETHDGITVEILIYRGKDDEGWLLEVVDEEDASTVWDDPFPTDQAALDEAMRTIEEEGIVTFLRPTESDLH